MSLPLVDSFVFGKQLPTAYKTMRRQLKSAPLVIMIELLK